MIRCFKSIGKLIRDRREELNLSQSVLSESLQYKNGQFISNVERALCSIPLKRIVDLSVTLSITTESIKEAMVADFVATLDNAIVKRTLEIEKENERNNSGVSEIL